jgi:hypothetical protein
MHDNKAQHHGKEGYGEHDGLCSEKITCYSTGLGYQDIHSLREISSESERQKADRKGRTP